MVTSKKAAPPKSSVPKEPSKTFSMPPEVKDWIERASSIMKHQKGEIDRLKEENAALKAYRKFAETRILRSDHE